MSFWRVARFVAQLLLLWGAFAVAYSRRETWFVGLLAGFITGTVFGVWATLEDPKDTTGE